MLNGNYAAAVRVYRSILDQPVTSVNPQLRADAAFGLGQAALREGQFAEALPALTEFISTYVSDPRLAQAHFLRGDAYMGLSQWREAITDFQIYLQKRPGLIDSYAYERIGDASLALGDTPQALANYDQAVKSLRGLVPLLLLREKLAAAYLNAGNLNGAIAQYDGILREARNPGYRAAINFSAADALIKSGNVNAALPRLQDIVDTAPESASAYRAMQMLMANNVPVNDLTRGRISFAAKDYQDAITALHNYTSVTPLGQIDPEVYMLLGRAYREVGNTAAANTAFQTILVQYPTSPQFGEAWLEQGRSLFLANRIPEAIAKYIELSEKHPNVRQGQRRSGGPVTCIRRSVTPNNRWRPLKFSETSTPARNAPKMACSGRGWPPTIGRTRPRQPPVCPARQHGGRGFGGSGLSMVRPLVPAR